MIRSHAWFSAAIVVTLALGIGINTTVFTLVNAVLFKPVPLPGGSRLVMISNTNQTEANSQFGMSYPDFVDFRKQNTSLESLEAIQQTVSIISESANPPARYRSASVSPGIFAMVRTAPILGRDFSEADGKAGAEPVLMISHRVWQGRYGGSREVVGRVVRLNGQPTTIIGVMPEGFLFPMGQDMWSPLTPTEELQKRSNRPLRLFGVRRENNGSDSLSNTTSDLSVIAQRLAMSYPDTNKNIGVVVQTFHQAFNGGNIRTIFFLMLGAVGFVLLIACANVANMMLSRALARRRENSVRAALGASRFQLVRQLLVESVLLSSMGGLLGLVLSRVAVHYFDLATLNERPYWIGFGMDYVAFAYFAAVSILSGVAFGVLPALRASRVDLAAELKEGTRNMISLAAGGGRLAGTLVILQFALTMVLLCGAGLMMRSFFKAQALNEFVPAREIFSARVTLPDGKGEKYEKKEDRLRFFDELERRVAGLPGVARAALSAEMPGGGSASSPIEIEGRPVPAGNARSPLNASYVVATPAYLELIGLNLVEGRKFEELDGSTGRESAIVTRQFASRYWPNESALGKRFRFQERERTAPWIQVVGVSNDMIQNPQQGDDAHPLAFVPYRQQGWRSMSILLRTATGVAPATMARPVKALVQELDQDLPVFDTQTVQESLDRQRWFLPVFGSLFLSFAVIGLLIASLGIYAVGAQAAASRTREIGIRMALGATTRNILATMLSRGLIYLSAGLMLGLGGALATTRFMKTFLIQVSPQDPFVLIGVAAVLGSIGFLACFLPAKRAAALHPVAALRDE